MSTEDKLGNVSPNFGNAMLAVAFLWSAYKTNNKNEKFKSSRTGIFRNDTKR